MGASRVVWFKLFMYYQIWIIVLLIVALMLMIPCIYHSLDKLVREPIDGNAWHADHIIPVYKGGGTVYMQKFC
jgi:hypothetical protein